MTAQTIAVIAGDGIGPEVIDSTRAVLDAVTARHGIDCLTLTSTGPASGTNKRAR
jgi:isocitrate/isopropylmalate dehydrogenase